MAVGIITYDTNHLKTEQVVLNLLQRGEELVLFALPFTARPMRQVLFAHRPAQFEACHPAELAKRLRLPLYPIEADQILPVPVELGIVCGGGILGKALVDHTRILNCHPGKIPLARGLDSFKWAILNDIPLANTLHTLDERVDIGTVHHIAVTPVFSSDSLQRLARRHYECEIALLSDFRRHLSLSTEVEDVADTPSFRRMPRETEAKMLDKSDAYIKRHSDTQVFT